MVQNQNTTNQYNYGYQCYNNFVHLNHIILKKIKNPLDLIKNIVI